MADLVLLRELTDTSSPSMHSTFKDYIVSANKIFLKKLSSTPLRKLKWWEYTKEDNEMLFNIGFAFPFNGT